MRPEYVVPYFVSNAVGLALLGAAFRWPNVTRWGIALTFLWAAPYNAWIGLSRPEEYQGFAQLAALPFYRDFIAGAFRENATPILLIIALGQAVITAALMLGGRWLWVGVAGACLFLTAIIPLGVGSAFPFSITVSLAAIVAWRRLEGTHPLNSASHRGGSHA